MNRRSQYAAFGAAVVLALAVGAVQGHLARAQDGTAPQSDPGLTSLTDFDDATIARRLLMSSIGSNNDAVHDMLDGVIAYDAFELESRLASMSAMLRAFPSLYRAEPNPYSEEAEAADPFTVSLATEQVWEDFGAFEAMSMEAWQIAQTASLAPRDQILTEVEKLEAVCESCHAEYRIVFEFFDFDSLPPADGSEAPDMSGMAMPQEPGIGSGAAEGGMVEDR